MTAEKSTPTRYKRIVLLVVGINSALTNRLERWGAVYYVNEFLKFTIIRLSLIYLRSYLTYLSPRKVMTRKITMLMASIGTLAHLLYFAKPYCSAKVSYNTSVRGGGNSRVFPLSSLMHRAWKPHLRKLTFGTCWSQEGKLGSCNKRSESSQRRHRYGACSSRFAGPHLNNITGE